MAIQSTGSPYIHTPETQFIDSPAPSPEGSNVGFSYNLLWPLDTERVWRPKFDQWIRSRLDGGLEPLPLGKEVIAKAGRNLFDYAPSRQVDIYFAQKIQKVAATIQQELKEVGKSLTLEKVLDQTEHEIKSVYELIIGEIEVIKQSARGGMIGRYETLKEAFSKACDVRNSVKWMLTEIEKSGCTEELLQKFIKVGDVSNFRNMQHLFRPEDNWAFRKKSVMETLSSVQKYAGDSPYFFSLQEVTPEILVDLKEKFPELQWISYNNLTGKETKSISAEEETVPQESTSLTVTIAFSSAWKIEKISKVWFSETPNVPSKIDKGAVIRPILGVEVIDPISSKKLVVINTHSDHTSMYSEVREITSKVFNEFIDQVTENRTIPYIAGGDLNTFENCAGQAYYEKLKGTSGDYRDKILYAPKEIQKITFVGLPADAFNAKIDQDGSFVPNALDHVFYSKDLVDLQWAYREAGVYDKEGGLIDPFKDRDAYKAALLNRNTASDHLGQVMVFKV